MSILKAKEAAVAHTNLYIFDAVVQILESSCRPQGNRATRAASRIIRICKQQQALALKEFDRAIAGVSP